MAQQQQGAGAAAAAEAPLAGIEEDIAEAKREKKFAWDAWQEERVELRRLKATEATDQQLAEQRRNVRVAQEGHTAATNR